MIRLENKNNCIHTSFEVAITRETAALIAPALAHGWRFVEDVEIGASPNLPPAPPEVKPEAPKPAKKPRAKAKEHTVAVYDAVRSRLSAGDGGPKSFAEISGPPLKDSAIRAALESMRSVGELVVTGQKRGTKYQLVAAPAPAAS